MIRAAAQAHLNALAKPPGSLGRLEALALDLAVARGRVLGPLRAPQILVFAADHGVAREEAVSPYPSAVTALMVRTFAADKAAVCLLARNAGAALEVIDVGVASPLRDLPTAILVRHARVAEGTANLARGPAMRPEERDAALAVGRAAADRAAAAGVDLLLPGEMGIGNTTAAAALAARLLGLPAAALVGPGTGLDAAGLAHKVSVVQRALDRQGPHDPLGALADLGGLEIAALTGLLQGAHAHQIPVLLDGFIVSAAALVAQRLDPSLSVRLIPATRSAEPGHAAILDALGLPPPLLDWGLRLGEASAAALALPLVRAAAALLDPDGGMATLEQVLAG
jgi:nicotinate-nucleotide--dimethylbenzimidazole phosphoribosyltransferase